MVWNSLHAWSMETPIPVGGTWILTEFFRRHPHITHWIEAMSQNITDYLQDNAVEEPVPSISDDSDEPPHGDDTEEEAHDSTTTETDPWNMYPYLVSQPDTPEENEWSLHDSDSEDLPSSLDTYITEAFALPSWPPSVSLT